MQVRKEVKKCSIIREFSADEQLEFFGIYDKKTLHHVDTLYYAVYLNEPDDIVMLQKEDKLPEYLKYFLSTMYSCKEELAAKFGENIDFGALEFVPRSFGMYEYCVSLNECFDIFISKYLPNAETPRIVVQLRSRYLVMEGVRDAISQSFQYLKDFLSPFGLFPVKVRENRIDFAYHTNLIQNLMKFFSDKNLQRHLKTSFKKGAKYFSLCDGVKIETLQLGNRRSNNVFFRAYNKVEEVIQLNYKAFFIHRWYQNGMISKFDKYVYEVAYEIGSYRTGCLVGRLKWYVDFGRDPKFVEECQKLLETNFIKSDNCTQIEKKLRGVIPEPTVIVNIEFQTKRKFYMTCAEFLENRALISDMLAETGNQVFFKYDPILKPINNILDCAGEIIEYITSYNGVICFSKNNKLSLKNFIDEGEQYCNWWHRIRHTPVSYSDIDVVNFLRQYDQNASILKSRRLFQGQVARLAILQRSDIVESSFEDDIADALCWLNDNDVPPFIKNPDYNIGVCDPVNYREIQIRKGRQLRGVIKNGAIKEYQNLKETAQRKEQEEKE
ncbi:MAG: hypothetical protein E7653_00145 [Ruminococcaceae bacterium]|nr:hypothetical protein [Oscillospiraceae bacterium]